MKNVVISIKQILDILLSYTFSDYIIKIFSVASVILVYFTLKEMQIQRKNTYMPDIVFDRTKISFNWIKNPQEEFFQQFLIKSYNIGVGVAKNIKISLEISSFVNLIEKLQKVDQEYIYNYDNFTLRIIKKNGAKHILNTRLLISEKLYLLPNGNETWEIFIPYFIIIILNRIYEISEDLMSSTIGLIFNLSYTDVQGIKYYKKLILNTYFETICIFEEKNENAEGYVTLQEV